MESQSRVGRVRLAVSAALALLAVGVLALAVPALAQQDAGTGRLEGTDEDVDEEFVATNCFEATHSIYELRGEGSYHGSADGGEAVYVAEVGAGEELHEAGPIEVEIEATETYYHGPSGTHGTEPDCSDPVGTPVPAEFRLLAEDNVHDGEGGPCTGQGQYQREGEDFAAEWTWDADCVVEGNEAGTPGSGIAEAGQQHTLDGVHEGCFQRPCPANIRVDYVQGEPEATPELTLDGPSSQEPGTEVTVIATLVDEGGAPVQGVDVDFDTQRIDGAGQTEPSSGTETTDAEGEAPFTFTTTTEGAYSVTATATHDGQELRSTHTVTLGQLGDGELALERVSGTGRVETALAVSQAVFDTADTAVLARADEFPDALTAASLAAEVGGPILITPSGSLPEGVADELQRLGVEQAYLAGGTGALAPQVADDVAALGIEAQRLDGRTRYHTAELVAREVAALGGAVTEVVLARDDDFPDALAAGNLATWGRAPILLTPRDELHPDAASAMTDPQVVSVLDATVAGGQAAVGPGAVQDAEASGYSVERVAGAERYATAAALVERALATTEAGVDPLYVASGLSFPDALVAGPAAHASGGVLALVDRDDLGNSAASRDFLEAQSDAVGLVRIVGGTAAVSEAVADQIETTVQSGSG